MIHRMHQKRSTLLFIFLMRLCHTAFPHETLVVQDVWINSNGFLWDVFFRGSVPRLDSSGFAMSCADILLRECWNLAPRPESLTMTPSEHNAQTSLEEFPKSMLPDSGVKLPLNTGRLSSCFDALLCKCVHVYTYVCIHGCMYSHRGVDRIPGFSKIKTVIFQTHR